MTEPTLIILDEPSLGLAPKLAEEMFQRVLAFRNDGVSVILIDQNVRRVVETSNYVYVFQLGEIRIQGTGKELAPTVESIVKEFI